MDDEEAITIIVERAIATPDAHLRLATAEEFIIGELERNRFNTERAIEVHTIAIDNSVWAWVNGMALGKLIYRDYKRTGLGKQYAIGLMENFKSQFRPPLKDQRPPRRFFAILAGRVRNRHGDSTAGHVSSRESPAAIC